MVTVSIGYGIRDVVQDNFRRLYHLRQVYVYPDPSGVIDDTAIPPDKIAVRGRMSEERRTRIQKLLIREWRQQYSRRHVKITRDRFAELADLEHVASVIPQYPIGGQASWGDHLAEVRLAAGIDRNHLAGRLVAGELFRSDDEQAVLVHEVLLYRWGLADDTALENLIGQRLRVELGGDQRRQQLVGLLGGDASKLAAGDRQALDKALKQLPNVLAQLDLTDSDRKSLRRLLPSQPGPTSPRPILRADYVIAGILADVEPRWDRSIVEQAEQTADLVLPLATIDALYRQTPLYEEVGYTSVLVTVDAEENVKGVVRAIQGMGLGTSSMVEFAERVHREVTLIRIAMTLVAVVALLVAALGITNTMVTTVLERTHEIGVMKAVGASDQQVQGLFLIEGTLLGLAGGLLGVLLAWLASVLGDSWARSIMEEQTQQKLTRSLFVFTPALVLGLPLFTALIMTLAAWFPARRAARIDPAIALRSE
jgi:putative ABC transport system permease protein